MTRIDLATEKERLRRKILQLRDQQDPRDIESKSATITKSVVGLSEFRKAGVVACYVSKGSEVQTQPFIQKVLSSRKKVLAPVVSKETRSLLFAEITSLEELAPGAFGILEPKPEDRKVRPLRDADVLFVPGIAWDINGYRLGWGRGYFDTALKQLPDKSTSIGLSFDLQVVDRVPKAHFDLPVDLLITESQGVRCHG